MKLDHSHPDHPPVARVRHINGYGLKYPRLDRLQGLGDYSSMQARRSLKWAVAELVCFNTPRQLFGRITALWNGRIVYQRHWHTLFDELRREWELMALIVSTFRGRPIR